MKNGCPGTCLLLATLVSDSSIGSFQRLQERKDLELALIMTLWRSGKLYSSFSGYESFVWITFLPEMELQPLAVSQASMCRLRSILTVNKRR